MKRIKVWFVFSIEYLILMDLEQQMISTFFTVICFVFEIVYLK